VLKISFKNIRNFYISIIHFSEDGEHFPTCTIFFFVAIYCARTHAHTHTIYALKVLFTTLKTFFIVKFLALTRRESNSLEVSISIIYKINWIGDSELR